MSRHARSTCSSLAVNLCLVLALALVAAVEATWTRCVLMSRRRDAQLAHAYLFLPRVVVSPFTVGLRHVQDRRFRCLLSAAAERYIVHRANIYNIVNSRRRRQAGTNLRVRARRRGEDGYGRQGECRGYCSGAKEQRGREGLGGRVNCCLARRCKAGKRERESGTHCCCCSRQEAGAACSAVGRTRW